MAGIYIFSDRADIAAEIVGFARAAGKEAFVMALGEEAAQATKRWSG